jgi:hypothetical protein
MKATLLLVPMTLGLLGACSSTALLDRVPTERLAHPQGAASSACVPIDTAVERLITVCAGVYGQLVEGCDTPDCCDTVIGNANWGVGVFASLPESGEDAFPLAFAAPITDGLYQLALVEGSYVLCTGELVGGFRMHVEGSCTNEVIGKGLTRIDWTSGPGGGRWSRPKIGSGSAGDGQARSWAPPARCDAGSTCSYPPVQNDPRCPGAYSWLHQGTPCPSKGLTCAYPGQGDGESDGCFATAMLWCGGDAGIGDRGDGGPDAGPGTWTAAQ